MVSVFDYFDYRQFLKALLEEKRKARPELSHRYIQQKLGYASSGHLANVLAGRKNLTADDAEKLAEVFKLRRAEKAYFLTLVGYCQAKRLARKTELYRQLLAFMPSLLRKEQLSLFGNWYFVAIREILNVIDFKGDYTFLANQLDPRITPREARTAVEKLVQLGLVIQDGSGKCTLAMQHVSSGDEVRSAELAQFQMTTMELARRALERTPGDLRDISTMTLSVDEKAFLEIKTEIQHFRKRISFIASTVARPDRVYQCNFQAFPLSRVLAHE